MDRIYRFDLEELQMMDVESDLPSMSSTSSDGEDEEDDGEKNN
jgi:hypothetical protein